MHPSESTTTTIACDIAVVGCGAAGMMAAIAAGRALARAGLSRLPSIIALDGAKKLGAKILVAGGGRCNVTHHRVDPSDYAGSTTPAIRKVLLHFGVDDTVAFFRELGVELKQEETGKLFPVTNDARTVLDAMMRAMHEAHVRVLHPWRVASVARTPEGFMLARSLDEQLDAETAINVRARTLILATGGKSLPRTGSDGAGYALATSLGHTITPAPHEGGVFPALVPLTLEKGHWLTQLAGVAIPATLEVRSSRDKKLESATGSTLFTHVGLSGPAALDISRHFTLARRADAGAQLVANWLPGVRFEQILHDAAQGGGHSIARILTDAGLPARVARACCDAAGADHAATVRALPRAVRQVLLETVTACRLPITGDRGWLFAEVTAGGVPLSELHLDTMESRVCPGLHLCGEVCDVDGRLGGFNFQWAWASGHLAGEGAARAYLVA